MIFSGSTPSSINISFILLTEHLSFLPSNILYKCDVISLKKSDIIQIPYKNIIDEIPIDDCDEQKNENVKIVKRKRRTTKKQPVILSFNDTSNLYIKYVNECNNLKYKFADTSIDLYTKVCMSLIYDIELVNNTSSLKRLTGKMLLSFRDKIYNIFIYHLDIGTCIWIIVFYFIERGFITIENYDKVILHTIECFHYMNNNYREIFHIERWLLSIIKLITYKKLE
jgi:hypothetical protein